MTAAEHPIQPEELMAWLDGEIAPEERPRIERHVAACDACQALAADLRGVSHDLTRWAVDQAPRTLTARRDSPATAPEPAAVGAAVAGTSPPAWQLRSNRPWLAAAAALVIVAIGSGLLISRARQNADAKRLHAAAEISASPGEAAARPGRDGQTPAQSGRTVGGSAPAAPVAIQPSIPPAGPMIARTATLRIISRDFDTVRPRLDRMLSDVNGFAARIDTAGARGEPRALSAVLHVPVDRLAHALTAIKALGQVISESQTGDDVTEHAVDLDARLLNSRNTEKRLLDVMQRSTGKVGDILEAEREIARVRGEIESMDAQRRNLAQRVTYATVSLDVREEQKASLDLGPSSVSTQLRNAIVDGFGAASSSMVAATLFVARTAPVLLLWGLVLAWPVRLLWRRGFHP